MIEKYPVKFHDLMQLQADIKIDRNELHDKIVLGIYQRSGLIARQVLSQSDVSGISWEAKLDDILTSRLLGFPIMILLLATVFWLTVAGANYPSEVLASIFFWGEQRLTDLFNWLGVPDWIYGLLILGMYRTLTWVVAVMLPPMAIFFPCFTLLEDLGYLPRAAFNLDRFFKKCGTHGKQALTMCMGLGCNAAGVTSCRIIESPRERLIAILTNNFVPCNGRFPTIIALSLIFMGGLGSSGDNITLAAAVVSAVVLSGGAVTMGVSWLLSKTLLRGVPSSFTLELPPFRKPQIMTVLIRSVFDRIIFVLTRAVLVAAPAGIIIWLLANIYIGHTNLIGYIAAMFDPFGRALGLDGFIIVAFLIGLPANEIVLPILIMGYLSTGNMTGIESLQALRELLVGEHGWTWLTALNTMLFSLLHFPCSTTLITVLKETGSWKWTGLAFFIPTSIAVLTCFILAQTARLLGLV